jgi:adenylosuccinate synthase
MSILSIVGLQWGDEGKGKIVDMLSEQADIVSRFQGGHNAGHTIVVSGTTYKLNLLPSNILREGKISIIGNGVVVDPFHLIEEIDSIKKSNITITPEKLIIAENACLILPIHKIIDEINESSSNATKIGTTKKGIGPAYADKISRRAIRVCDLNDEEILKEKINNIIEFYSPILQNSKKEIPSKEDLYNSLKGISEFILSFAKPAWKIINEAQKANKKIMFEGAQGVMLDIDHGTYPFVTSSNTVTGQLYAGSGIGANTNTHHIGVVKAYTTRVGEGPFPSELNDDIGKHLAKVGHEVGTVTGRARRCGWIDLVQLKQMIQICGINSIAITKLDVLSGLDKIGICEAYDINGKKYDHLPASQKLQAQAKPIIKYLDGWQEDITNTKSQEDLPENAKKYLTEISKKLEIQISIISTGPDRNQTIILKDLFPENNIAA